MYHVHDFDWGFQSNEIESLVFQVWVLWHRETMRRLWMHHLSAYVKVVNDEVAAIAC